MNKGQDAAPFIGLSPSGKARDFDSLIPWVQIPPVQPSLQDKKYIQPTNGENKPVVGCITFVFDNSDRCIFLSD